MAFPVTLQTWANDMLANAVKLNANIYYAMRHLAGLDGTTDFENAIELKDLDGTPVGDVRLKNQQQALNLRNAADNAYLTLKIDCFDTGGTSATVAIGNHTHSTATDTSGSAASALTNTSSNSGQYKKDQAIASGADYDVASTTNTFASGATVVGIAWVWGTASGTSSLKLRLIMDGVQVAESGYMTTSGENLILTYVEALTGSKIVIARLHNYHGSASRNWSFYSGANGDPAPGLVSVGSFKFP